MAPPLRHLRRKRNGAVIHHQSSIPRQGLPKKMIFFPSDRFELLDWGNTIGCQYGDFYRVRLLVVRTVDSAWKMLVSSYARARVFEVMFSG